MEFANNKHKQCIVLFYYGVAVCYMALFLYGFFPVKVVARKQATSDDIPEFIGDIVLDTSKLYEPLISRLVVMIIDALRVDFVYDDNNGMINMPYTSSLLRDNKAYMFFGKVSPPTVTMPRIKAITTGSPPSFIDVVLNFGSAEIIEDNIIHQAVNKGLKAVFYGDDTWLKLYPTKFIRSEGTSSFFVSDFWEVDTNVTRHLPSELNADDWTLMVLHYLGLDHIGHVEGPKSENVRLKLNEMDQVIKEIHLQMNKWDSVRSEPSLLIVCGDHGMKDSGGHGGSSLPEIMVPILIIGQKFSSHAVRNVHFFNDYIFSSLEGDEIVVPQTDLAPTLSMLLGLPIPSGNIGKVIWKMLQHLPLDRQLYYLYYNTKQVSELYGNNYGKILKDCNINHQEACKLHENWLKSESVGERMLAEKIINNYISALSCMGSELAQAFVKFDTQTIWIVLGILTQVTVIIFMASTLRLKYNDIMQTRILVLALFLVMLNTSYCLKDASGLFCKIEHGAVIIILITAVFAAVNLSLLNSIYKKGVNLKA